MELTLQKLTHLSMPRSKGIVIGFWTLLPADRLYRLRATAPAAGGGGIRPPRFPGLLPDGALVGG